MSIDADALFERFRQRVEPTLSPTYRVAVAYSGGLDSTVLLHLFARLRASVPFQLSACHVHHGLSPHADAWLEHCAGQCAVLAVPLVAERVDLTQVVGGGVEERARHARYAIFEALGVDCVAMAHHRDDQAETVVYRLARGAGLRGAAGMPVRRRLGQAASLLWRPLLDESRHALLAYANAHQLAWVTDESNTSDAYDRNYLRQVVLPSLYARFPAAPVTIARAAQHWAEAAELVDALAEIDAGGWRVRLPIQCLVPLSEMRQRNVLQWFLGRHGVRLEAKQLALLLGQILTAKPDTNPCLRVGDRVIHRYRDELWVAQHLPAPSAIRLEEGVGEQVIPAWGGVLQWRPADGGLAPDMLHDVELRPRLGGESIQLHAGGSTRAVKTLFQEAGIPPWLRARWPLLWRGGELLAVPGIGVATDYQVANGAAPHWRPFDWADAP